MRSDCMHWVAARCMTTVLATVAFLILQQAGFTHYSQLHQFTKLFHEYKQQSSEHHIKGPIKPHLQDYTCLQAQPIHSKQAQPIHSKQAQPIHSKHQGTVSIWSCTYLSNFYLAPNGMYWVAARCIYGHGFGHCGLSATSTSRLYSLLTATSIY